MHKYWRFFSLCRQFSHSFWQSNKRLPFYVPRKQSRCLSTYFPSPVGLPINYSHINHCHFKHFRDHKVQKRQIISQDIMMMLNEMVSLTGFSLILDTDISVTWNQLRSYSKFCFNLRCPLETLHIRPDSLWFPRLRRLRRWKEYESTWENHKSARQLTKSIKIELSRLNYLY